MDKIKNFAERLANKARSAKFAVGAMAAWAVVPVVSVVASAEDTGSSLGTYKDQITAQFSSTANDVIPIIVGVLGAGLGVFAIFVGIKLAKKMFTTVAK